MIQVLGPDGATFQGGVPGRIRHAGGAAPGQPRRRSAVWWAPKTGSYPALARLRILLKFSEKGVDPSHATGGSVEGLTRFQLLLRY